MSLTLSNPEQSIAEIIDFLQITFTNQRKKAAVIAVSGGIDSALSLTLLTKAVGAENVYPLFLPYADQSVLDSHEICEFNAIPEHNWLEVNIEKIVSATQQSVGLSELEPTQAKHVRLGNLMARARMMVVYDQAKQHEALVCGTENKSEHYLGYFTRFGDAASDIEPICHLYKTQVRQLVEHLQMPTVFLNKAPSAGLWADQTDEHEMGFSYDQADQVLAALEAAGYLSNLSQLSTANISVPGIEAEVVQKVINQVSAMAFKLVVPYQVTF